MATENEQAFHDYLLIMRRRAPYLIGIFVTGFIIAIIVAFSIPPTYRSTATILVESQQVSDNVLPSSIKNQINEKINVIMQRVMVRDNLLQIAKKYSVFEKTFGSLTASEVMAKMASRIVVEPISSNEAVHTNQTGLPTIAFSLSFEDRRPEVAYQVANDLVTLFLNLNVKLRAEDAAATTAFLAEESGKLQAEVERLENLISEFKQQNKNALPEQLTLRMTMLSRAENDLREVERDYRSTKEDLRTLEVELAAAKRGTGEDNPSQTLPALKAEYARISAIYTESHPDVRSLKRKIEAMEKGTYTAEPASGVAVAETSSLAVYKLQAKIDSDNARLISLAQQREELQSKIAENERAMIQTPKVGQELDLLIRDRDIAQKKYEEIRNKKTNAQIAESLESENKAERFTVLEPPILPEKPFKPKRLKILAMGFFLAIAVSGGSIMFWEAVDKKIYGVEALTQVLGHRPLAVIQYFPILEEVASRRRMLKRAIFAAVVALVAVSVALHFLNLYLDILLF